MHRLPLPPAVELKLCTTPQRIKHTPEELRQVVIGIFMDLKAECKEGNWLSQSDVQFSAETTVITTLNAILKLLTNLEKNQHPSLLELDNPSFEINITLPPKFKTTAITAEDYYYLQEWAEDTYVIIELLQQKNFFGIKDKMALPTLPTLPETQLDKKEEIKFHSPEEEYAGSILRLLFKPLVHPRLTPIQQALETQNCAPIEQLYAAKAQLEVKLARTGWKKFFHAVSLNEKILASLKKSLHKKSLIFAQLQPHHIDHFKYTHQKLLCLAAYILRDIKTLSTKEINQRVNACLMQLFQGENQAKIIQFLIEKANTEYQEKITRLTLNLKPPG